MASMTGNLVIIKKEILKFLVQHGGNINELTLNQKNCIHLAAEKDLPFIIAFLAEIGDLVDKKDNRKQTPLHLAVDMNSYKSAGLLLALNVKKNKKDLFGQTALHVAAKNNNVRMIRLLLLKGFDKNAIDSAGKTPEKLAFNKDAKDLFKDSGFFEVFGCKTLAIGSKKNFFPVLSLIFVLFTCLLLNSIFLETCKNHSDK